MKMLMVIILIASSSSVALADEPILSVADFKLDQSSYVGSRVNVRGFAVCDSDHCEMDAESNTSVTVTFMTKRLPRATRARLLQCSGSNDEPCKVLVTGTGGTQNVDIAQLGEQVKQNGLTSAITSAEEAECDLSNVTEVDFE